MTVNAVRRRGKVARAAAVREEKPLPIGEVDANIVDCPVCKRPLDTTSRRCPGCRTLFVLGVQASKASVLVSVGLAAGLLLGGGVVAVAVPRAPAIPLPTAAPIATAAPAATTGTVPTPGSVPTPAATIDGGQTGSGIPSAATAALRGTATVNSRIASAATPLVGQLAASTLDAQEVARVMRRLSFEAGAAQALLPSLAAWPQASALQSDLTAFYADVRAVAGATLASSVRDEAAFRDGARQMLATLARLPALEEASRTLAASAEVELPAVVGQP